MSRRVMVLAALAVGVLPFSSCTCRNATPETPVSTVERRSGGFGAVATRKLPERVAEVVTPPELPAATPPPLPTKPATPDQGSIPDNFPEGIPVPDGSKVMAVQSLANDARNVIFAMDGDDPGLFRMYKNTMENSGWGKPTQQYEGKEQSFLSFKKGDTITNISVSKDPKTGRRIVAVMYYEEQPLPFPEF
jgi:hypothetical protein